MEALIIMILLTMLAVVSIAIVRTRNLFSVVVLGGIYSFLMASVMIVLDGVDVAMTEASVGAGISTVLMLATLYLTKTEEAAPRRSVILPLTMSVLVAGALLYGISGLPDFGLADNPVHLHVGPHYLTQSMPETGIPNVVTSVLASYRGFDTLGETTVIFAAGVGLLMLLRKFKSATAEKE